MDEKARTHLEATISNITQNGNERTHQRPNFDKNDFLLDNAWPYSA